MAESKSERRQRIYSAIENGITKYRAAVTRGELPHQMVADEAIFVMVALSEANLAIVNKRRKES